ncbi:Fic family protein [Cumulibacter soli]|uniref:Fic family protein n=1 Tax=Cumulibacter soli TaxID=2546344 RepID=UPI0014197A42|nr:Fic family protein [Cumulibacter soli]
MTAHRFLETHPWLTFELDLNRLNYKTWLLLGEAGSKCEHVAGVPLTPSVAKTLHEVYLSKGIHGTASIEGNTLSEEEVQKRIGGDLPLPQSQAYLGKEIDNIVEVCNRVVERVIADDKAGISVGVIKEYNRSILEGLPLKPDVTPGQIRKHSVTVGLSSYRGAPAADCEMLLEKLVDWLNSLQAPRDCPELAFPLAVLKSILAHLYIAWIHPFGDGNGRTARLVEFQLMIEAGAPVPAAHLLSDHYNRTRDAYLVELDRTSREPGFPIEGFIQYALRGFVDELVDQIETIKEQQRHITWINYVHDRFHNEETPAKLRQRLLVLDFPAGETVARAKIPDVSVRIAREYAKTGDKTLTRDLNELVRRGLLVRGKGGYRTNHGIIEAFLPATYRGTDD